MQTVLLDVNGALQVRPPHEDYGKPIPLNRTTQRPQIDAFVQGSASDSGNATEVTWAQADGTTSGTPGTATALTASTQAQRAIIRADDGNSASISIGPDNNASFTLISAGGEYLLEAPAGCVFDLGAWYVKSTSASQAYSIIYV